MSRIFDFEKGGTVYSRADGLMSASGMIGYALNALKQAMHGAESERLLLLPYETLTRRPREAIAAVYAFTGLEPFEHDFDNVAFDTAEFDARLGTPGLHDVRPQVRGIERRTVLPPDLWARYEGSALWRAPEFNTRGVPIACEPTPHVGPNGAGTVASASSGI